MFDLLEPFPAGNLIIALDFLSVSKDVVQLRMWERADPATVFIVHIDKDVPRPCSNLSTLLVGYLTRSGAYTDELVWHSGKIKQYTNDTGNIQGEVVILIATVVGQEKITVHFVSNHLPEQVCHMVRDPRSAHLVQDACSMN